MRIDLVLDTVKTSHKDSRVAEIRIAGSVGIAKLKSALFGALGICGDTNYRGAVGGCITYGYGSLKSRNKTLEGVC